jgi:hypothetical protein
VHGAYSRKDLITHACMYGAHTCATIHITKRGDGEQSSAVSLLTQSEQSWVTAAELSCRRSVSGVTIASSCDMNPHLWTVPQGQPQ